MRFESFSSIIYNMFTDRVDITRYEEVENDDGTTNISLPDTPLYSDIPCRLSFSSQENPGDIKEDENPIVYTPKIFTKVDQDLKAGDYVVVRRLATDQSVLGVYEGTLGASNIYPTHKETRFLIEGSA